MLIEHLSYKGWRLGAPLTEPPHRDTEALCLVGKVALNAGTGKDDDADRQRLQHRVIALERC